MCRRSPSGGYLKTGWSRKRGRRTGLGRPLSLGRDKAIPPQPLDLEVFSTGTQDQDTNVPLFDYQGVRFALADETFPLSHGEVRGVDHKGSRFVARSKGDDRCLSLDPYRDIDARDSARLGQMDLGYTI